jgi:riboflavin kinase/FMN adenylyltransferase
MNVKHVVTGYDFAFGKGRGGSGTFLTEKARALNFGFTAHPRVFDATGQTISTSAIRTMLAQGRLADARAMLGHPYQIAGHVQHGEKRGRTLGFPTINLSLARRFKPRLGVYAGRVMFEDGPMRYDAAISIGSKPTFGRVEPLLEAHCFGLAHEVYGRLARVELVQFLRDEESFPDAGALVERMKEDCARAAQLLKHHA